MTLYKTVTPAPVDGLLPHRGPLRLVDTLMDYGNDHLKVSLAVRDHAPFGDGLGGVPGYVGLEYMAQAISVFSGLELHARGAAPRIGLLVGTRQYRATVPRFMHGEILEVSVRRLMGSDGEVWVFHGHITGRGGQLLAEAQVKAYRPEDIQDFLHGH